MRIKKIISQTRRDFTAMLICEHCSNEWLLDSGYDDDFYHAYVIPALSCKKCGKEAPDDYKAKGTKYAAQEVI